MSPKSPKKGKGTPGLKAAEAPPVVAQDVFEPEQPEAPRVSPFEAIKRINDFGQDFWPSRDLARLIGYSDYRNFTDVIGKAKIACKNSGQEPSDHFGDVTDMIPIGRGGKRAVPAVELSRYACYLVIQNADPEKKLIAAGQTYFAVQTRRQELASQDQAVEDQQRLVIRSKMREHNLRLADAAKDAGVTEPRDYAIFQNHGYQGLYGGLGVREIHQRKGLGKSQEILDHMGSTELAANLFRATQTEQKLRREGITGKANANRTHLEIGRIVRKTIAEIGGAMPEDLPSAPSLKGLAAKERKAAKVVGASKDEKDS
jgi:DNA-damage-inducible protein D